jgi:hypothetical protein
MIERSELLAFCDRLREPAALRERRLEAFGRLAPAEHPSGLPVVPATDIHVSGGDEQIVAGPIGEMDDVHKKLAEAAWGGLLAVTNDLALLRHTAFLTAAHVIFIPPEWKGPAIRVQVRASGPWSATGLLVLVGEGAQATIIDDLRGNAEVASRAMEVIATERSRVEIVSVQSLMGSAATVFQRGRMEGEGSIIWRNASVGTAPLIQDLESTVSGDGGESSIDWLLYARGMERHALSVRNIFAARGGSGEIAMKAVAEEKAHASLRGLIAIGLGGGGTDTYLTQEVLMLDPTSKVDAVPGLEIKTNDVKASHSATVSRVTPEDLFYFASRGVEEREARRMFVEGFIGDLAGRITDAPAREAVLAIIAEKYLQARPTSGRTPEAVR